MKLFKRTYISLAGYVEELVKIIENHDSLSQAVIAEFEDKYAEARVRLETLKAERQKLETAAHKSAEAEVLWEKRAIEASSKDKEQALECLKRKKQKEIETEELRKQLAEFQKAESVINKDLQILSGKLQELKSRRSILRAREAKTEALTTAGRESLQGVTGLDGIFEEWERKLIKEEVRHGSQTAIATEDSFGDELEKSFLAAEERKTLEAELARLIQTETK